MDIRLMVKDGDRRATLPVKDVRRIEWTDDESVICQQDGGQVVLPAASVVTIYRDEAPPKPRRRNRTAKPAAEPETD